MFSYTYRAPIKHFLFFGKYRRRVSSVLVKVSDVWTHTAKLIIE